MAAKNKREAIKQANAAVNRWSAELASIAYIPGSHYAMTARDVAIIMEIGSIFDVDLDKTAARKLFARVVAPVIESQLTHLIIDFIPGAGWVAKSAVDHVLTKAISKALIEHFHDCSDLPD